MKTPEVVLPDPSGPLRRRADPRLLAYLVGGMGALVFAIATGRHELAALGAPFIVLAARGLADRTPPELRGAVTLLRDRLVEGGLLEGQVHSDWNGEAEVDLMLAGIRGVTPLDPGPVLAWSLGAARGPVSLPFRVRAEAWGIHDLGVLWIRLRRPGGLVVWERELARAPDLRVMPTPLRLDRLLKPREPRTAAGMHLSRLRGHGTDFAELRPYRPGDRLRNLSWGTSARLGEPWVTVHHPERTGTVLLLLDAFFSEEDRGTEALARAARAAWAVAAVHLGAQDRVGLLARGKTAAWVPPRGGRRARWMLIEELLSVGGAAEDLRRRRRHGTRFVIPSDALIVGVTTLRFRAFTRDLIHHRRMGHTTAALVIDTSDLLPPARDPIDTAALRIWDAEREAERRILHRGGVPTALVRASEGVAPAVMTLHRRMNAFRQPRRLGSAQ